MKTVEIKGKAVCSASAAQFVANLASHRDAYDRLTTSHKYSKDIAHIYVSRLKNGLVYVVFADSRNQYIVAYTGDPEQIPQTLADERAEDAEITFAEED